MSELVIYDSQGKQFGAGGGVREDDRIKDFFFDGVRFALDMHLANEAVVFFRARENQTARSEQYYAVYDFENRSELQRLGDEIRRFVEEDNDMLLDTSKEDTEVFQYLVGDRSEERQDISCPGRREDLEDLNELLEGSRNLQLGVGSYRDACGTFNEFATKKRVNRFAIADNAGCSHLSDFDVVVEVGSYTGLEALGETADNLEALRERRRERLQAGSGETSDSGGPVSQLLNADTWAVDVAFGVVVVLVLLVGGVYGACAFAGGPSALGAIPVLGNGCDTGGPDIGLSTPTYDAANETLQVSGTIGSGNGSHDATFRIFEVGAAAAAVESGSTPANGSTATATGNTSGIDYLFNETVTVNTTGGNFSEELENVSLDGSAAGYNVTVAVGDSAASAEFTPGNAASDGAATTAEPTATAATESGGTATAEPTATTTAASTATATAAPTATATAEPTAAPTATDTPTATATDSQSTETGTDSGSTASLAAPVIGLSAVGAVIEG